MKNIVLLSDGTGNSASALFKTNVWRLYQALDLIEPVESGVLPQVACYNDGVGTSAFKPLAMLGGMFGWGLKRNVLHMYEFLCRNYQSADRYSAAGLVMCNWLLQVQNRLRGLDVNNPRCRIWKIV